MTPAESVKSADAAARERIRHSLGESLIVDASAGTGKTSELIRRIVRALASGAARVERIVAVTFTHKAAGELKIRLRQGLDDARPAAADDRERASLEDALERLEEAAIGTIHGFCAQILRERPVEARIDPEFEELTEQEAARLYDGAFDRWFQQALESGAPGVRRALARLAWRDSWEAGPPIDQLKYAGRKLVEWRDFTAPWRRDAFEREGVIDRLVESISRLAEIAAQCVRTNDALKSTLRPATEMIARIARSEQAAPRDYDTVEALLLKLERDLKRHKKNGAGLFASGIKREDVVAARDRLLDALAEFRVRAGAGLAAQLRAEMQDLVSRYTELKKRSGKLDFVDLLVLVRDLLRSNRDVREYLQKRYDRIFVDEFQDTDPLQAEILILLAADDPAETDWLKVTPVPGKLFLVGDPKQSIYKFRRADVVLYKRVCSALESRGVGRVTLAKSFRAVRPIQEFVNAAFASEMTGDAAAGQAEYTALEEHWAAFESQPAIVALPAPKPYGTRRISKERIDECLPGTVAAFIAWLVNESGWSVRDPQSGERVPVQARHICVLFRRFVNWGKDVTREYVRALDSRGIPHLLAGSRSFHHREEVETVRAALTAVEWPDDELSVFAALRGSLFAIGDEELLRFRFVAGRLHPFRRIPENLDAELKPVAEALAALAELHRRRNRRPIADTVNSLLEATRAHAGFALRSSGPQALANVYRICDLARAFEATGGISFRGFVEELTRQAEKAESADAPLLEEASDGVRLMTVHTAKGLEFPIVILADMTANLTAAEPDRWIDVDHGLCATRLLRCAPWELLEHEAEEQARERAEGIRVAYVAATRARDLLVVPVVGDEERDGWLAPLNKAVYPARAGWRLASHAPGCPEFPGDRTVLDRPMFDSVEGSVLPGMHVPSEGKHAVVWWDPAALDLDVPENFGLRQEDILSPEPAERAQAGVRRYEAWKEERRRIIEAGQQPRFEILSPTETGEAPPAQYEVRVETLPAPGSRRSSGRRFGTLVHAILRDLDFDEDAGQIAALARMHGKVLGAREEEIAAAQDAAAAVLRHPLIERARRAERCHREVPLLLKLDDGRLLEGVLDLAFLESGVWTVVDFKSDSGASIPSAYDRQLQWYLHGLSRVTGLPARGVLLRV